MEYSIRLLLQSGTLTSLTIKFTFTSRCGRWDVSSRIMADNLPEWFPFYAELKLCNQLSDGWLREGVFHGGGGGILEEKPDLHGSSSPPLPQSIIKSYVKAKTWIRYFAVHIDMDSKHGSSWIYVIFTCKYLCIVNHDLDYNQQHTKHASTVLWHHEGTKRDPHRSQQFLTARNQAPSNRILSITIYYTRKITDSLHHGATKA